MASDEGRAQVSVLHSSTDPVIYGLVDPREPERVRYVGKAVNLERRLRDHVHVANRNEKYPVSSWIRELLAADIRPCSIILSTTTTERWQDEERFFIEIYGGPDLLNVMPGGQGGSTAVSLAIWEDPQFRARMTARTKAQWEDPQFLAMMSARMKARWGVPEFRAMMSKRMTTQIKALWADPKFREQMSTKAKARWANPEFREQQLAGRKAANTRRLAAIMGASDGDCPVDKRPPTTFLLTGEQIRAARALLRIEQKELALLSGVSLPTVQRYEATRGPLSGSYQTIDAIQRALEKAGIRFTETGVEFAEKPEE